MADVPQSGWNNPSAPPRSSQGPLTHEQMAERLREIEALCAEVYSAAVERENYDLVTAESGPAAIAAVEGRPTLDLLIADVMMPDMRGPELAERLRATYPDLPVLYQTGFSDELFDGIQDLGDRSAFVEKPFTARGLLEAARLVMFGSLNPPNG